MWVSDPEGTFNSGKIAHTNLVMVAAGSGKQLLISSTYLALLANCVCSMQLQNNNIHDDVYLDRICPHGLYALAGFTPMVKLLRDFFLSNRNTADSHTDNSTAEKREHTQCVPRTAKLIFANKTEKDIWWRDELRQLVKARSEM